VRNRGIPRYGLIVLAATVGVAVGLGAALVHNHGRSPGAQQEAQPLAAQVTWSAGTKPRRASGCQGTWYWLLGSRSRLASVWRAYGIGVRRERGDIAHSVALYVIDKQGDLRAAYVFPFSASAVAHDVHVVGTS
jgi:hypothetical protein